MGRAAALARRRDVQVFTVGVLVYVATRFVGLTRFPIYFFCDEAVQSTLADGLIHNGFRSSDGVLFPPFLRNDQRFNLSLSVYAQVVPVALFGMSVFVTRATSVVLGGLVIVGVVVVLRVLGVRAWWISPFVLASLPMWFLHSRTAFEVVLMVAAYACFLGAYLLYRCRSARWAPVAILCGAATFYSYANGQGLMALTCLLLLISDVGYHRAQLRNRRVLVTSAVTAVVCALPYLRERRLHPSTTSEHLRSLGSYWYEDLSLPDKLWRFATTYARGLDPRYWFIPDNGIDLSRHVMKGMGHVWWVLAPYVLVGLVVCIRRWRSPRHRVVLIALVAAPFSAAMVEVIVTRALVMVVPITLLCCIGIDASVRLATSERGRRLVLGLTTGALVALTLGMTQSALADGDRWYDDYSLYGLQWGSRQVFSEVDARLAADPELRVFVSAQWANFPLVFVDFFVAPENRGRVEVGNIDDVLAFPGLLDPDVLYILDAQDLVVAQESGKVVVAEPDATIPWPDGRVGFTITHLSYADDVDAVFAAEAAARREIVLDRATIGGLAATVGHSRLSLGEIGLIGDGDIETLVRTDDTNPLVLDITLDDPIPLSRVELVAWPMTAEVDVVVTDDAGEVVARAHGVFEDTSQTPTFTLDLLADAGSLPVTGRRVHIELRAADRSARDVVHLREIRLN